MDRSSGRPDGPVTASGSDDDVVVRRALHAAISGLRPIVTQSHDGLTFVILGTDGRPAGRPADLAAAFPLPRGAVGVAVGLFDRLVALESFADADALADAWLALVTDAMEAWVRERDAIEARRAPAPGRLRPDDGAPDRLLRRATVAVGAATPAAADGAKAARSSGAAVAGDSPDDVTVPIRGERVEGSARVVDGRVVRLSLHRREPPDPPDGLVP